MRQFAITDIHGCLHTFQALLDKVRFSRGDELYLMGDYIDRGPDSKGVLDYIMELQEAGYQVHCLMGNHDLMMLESLGNPETNDMWLSNGGKETLKSFGAKKVQDIPGKYFDFISGLHPYFEVGPYLLVHAGLNFKNENPLADTNAMLWERNWYAGIDREWLGERIILHGHTPLFREELEQQHQNLDAQRYLGLDSGCVYTNAHFRRLGMGVLCAFNLNDRSLAFVENQESRKEMEFKPKGRLAAFFSMFSF
jgi:serine/threonine protein phosphatase 1